MRTRRALGWLAFLLADLAVMVLEGPSVNHIGVVGPVVGAAILPTAGFLADLGWCEFWRPGRHTSER